MSNFDLEYWNVVQTAVWVVYRNPELLENVSEPSSESWAGLIMYPSMYSYEKVAKLSVLAKALQGGDLKASGLPSGSNQQFQDIPPIEWSGLTINPPIIFRQDAKSGKFEPWTDIKIRSADVKRLWPSPAQSKIRELHGWEAIEKFWLKAVSENQTETSQRKIIELVQERVKKELKREPPSRTRLQDSIKEWRLAD